MNMRSGSQLQNTSLFQFTNANIKGLEAIGFSTVNAYSIIMAGRAVVDLFFANSEKIQTALTNGVTLDNFILLSVYSRSYSTQANTSAMQDFFALPDELLTPVQMQKAVNKARVSQQDDRSVIDHIAKRVRK